MIRNDIYSLTCESSLPLTLLVNLLLFFYERNELFPVGTGFVPLKGYSESQDHWESRRKRKGQSLEIGFPC